ncbi:hypothetical protein ACFRAM_10655 [Paenibacillus sp. NPDC056722]|uniref:hypothetical protein n=1 Tax=Paenibacillus sp. NPDC056722 TaxID=3345924 RepID=UPI00368CAC34
MSWIYIVAVIIFAIVSNVNKANKTKGKGAPPGGMPTFGGGGGDDNPLRRVKRELEQQGRAFAPPGTPVPRETRELAREEQELEESFPVEREQQWIPGPDAEVGNGSTLEQGEELDSVDIRTEKMRQELERIHAVFDDMAGESSPSVKHSSERVSSGTASSPVLATSREDLRKGLIWAEILGPPRSKRPHAYRKES